MIERGELCTLLPHAGDMCLLDSVEYWSQTSIRCISNSHLLSQNPLSTNNQLVALHAIEYGAQTMGVHGGLLAREQGTQPAQGFIAALRDINLYVDYLHDKPDPMHIQAEALLQNVNAMIYSFQINSGDVPIADGRITVVLAS